jgi:hypothetical protein
LTPCSSSKALEEWRLSVIRKVLTVVPKYLYFVPEVFPSMVKHGRQLDDPKYLHGLFQAASKKFSDRFENVCSILDKMAELKDTVPDGEFQAYCEAILASSAKTMSEYRRYDLSWMNHLLERSLPLAEDAIRTYARKVMQVKTPYLGSSLCYLDEIISISNVFGEEGLDLLFLAQRHFVDRLSWLIKLLTKSASIDIWKSELFLTRFCAELLDPAIAQMEPKPKVERYFDYRYDTYKFTVTKEELKLLIKLLQDLSLEETLDKLTSKMAQFSKLGVDGFRDVLGDGKVKAYGKKRKAVEIEKERNKKRPRPAMRVGKLIAMYD